MEPEPEVVKKPSKQQDSVAPTIKVSPPGSSDDTPGGPSFGNELNAGAAKIETPPGNLKGLPEPSSSIINARSIAFTTGAVAAVVAIGTLLIWTRRVKRHGRYRASSPSIFTRLRSNFRRGRSLNSLDNGNRVELVYDYGDSVARKSKPSSPNISTKLQTPHYANTIPGQITLPPSRLVKIDDIYVEQPPGVSFVQEIDPSIDYNAATVVSERMSLGPHTDLLHYDTQLDDSYPQNPTIRALKNGNNDGSGGRISSFATNESVMFFEDPDLSHNPHTDNLVSKPPIVGKKVARPKTGKHDPTADARRKHTSASSSIYSDI